MANISRKLIKLLKNQNDIKHELQLYMKIITFKLRTIKKNKKILIYVC